MAGLKRMVLMRGGIRSLTLPLQMKLHLYVSVSSTTGAIADNSSTDLTGATLIPTEPYFELEPLMPVSIYTVLQLKESPVPDKAFLAVSTYLDPNLVDILREMKRFSNVISAVLTPGSPRIHPGLLLDGVFSIHHQLSSLSGFESNSREDALQESCRLGALLYTREALQGIPTLGILPLNVVIKLKTHLMLIDESFSEPILLWLLVLGGIRSQTDPLKTWFIDGLVKLARVLGVSTWMDAQRVLKDFIWVGEVLDKQSQLLWEEVEAARVFQEAQVIALRRFPLVVI
jgi:hypothetical protein